MPILALDQYGRIYETSPDRMDGLGYKSHARPVGHGDLTLGNAYLKSQAAYQSDVLRERQAMAAEARADQIQRLNQIKRDAKERQRAAEENAMMQQPERKKLQTLKALRMNGQCSCPTNEISGDGLTANGQRGYAGMNRDQQVIHQHLAPGAMSAAHPVDPMEVYQARMKDEANRYILANARLAAAKR